MSRSNTITYMCTIRVQSNICLYCMYSALSTVCIVPSVREFAVTLTKRKRKLNLFYYLKKKLSFILNGLFKISPLIKILFLKAINSLSISFKSLYYTIWRYINKLDNLLINIPFHFFTS